MVQWRDDFDADPQAFDGEQVPFLERLHFRHGTAMNDEGVTAMVLVAMKLAESDETHLFAVTAQGARDFARALLTKADIVDREGSRP